MIVYNTSNFPIFITTRFEPDLTGGPAIRKVDYCIMPGDGIELEILGLKENKNCDQSPKIDFKRTALTLEDGTKFLKAFKEKFGG